MNGASENSTNSITISDIIQSDWFQKIAQKILMSRPARDIVDEDGNIKFNPRDITDPRNIRYLFQDKREALMDACIHRLAAYQRKKRDYANHEEFEQCQLLFSALNSRVSA